MNTTFLAWLGWPEITAILVIVLILFGARKLPELAKGLGQGIKEFKKASREVQDEIQRSIEEDPPPPPPPPPPRKPASPETPETVSQSSDSPKA
jgi:sec-independent protein translocase protein TatA